MLAVDFNKNVIHISYFIPMKYYCFWLTLFETSASLLDLQNTEPITAG